MANNKFLQLFIQNLHAAEKSVTQQELIELRKGQKRHTLLHECKINGIDINLKSGDLATVFLGTDFNGRKFL